MNSLDKSREGIGLSLFAILALVALGLLILHEVTDNDTIGGVATALSILERMAAILVTLSVSIYAVVEGTAMLYERYAKRRFQEGKEEGIHLGVIERDKEWDSWLDRREKALAEGQPFDEPPPSSRASKNGH